MASFTSKATGNWGSAGQTTWNEAGVPGVGDTATIQSGHTVTVDVPVSCTMITIEEGGELTDAVNNQGITAVNTILLSGTLTMGSATLSSGSGQLIVNGMTVGAAAVFFRCAGAHNFGSLSMIDGHTVTM